MVSNNMWQDADVRRAVRMARINARNGQRDGPLALAPPEVPAAIDGYDGLLPATALQRDLEVCIPMWDSPGGSQGDVDTVTLRLVDTAGVVKYSGDQSYTLPLDPGAFPTPVFIPRAEIPAQGTYKVEYTVKLFNGNPDNSGPFQIIIDREPPYYKPGQPATPAAITVPVEVVTDEYLDNNGDELVCTLPDYPDKRPGDQVSVYLGLEIPDGIDVTPVVGPIDVPVDLQIRIPGAEIKKRSDGRNYILYWLNDRAGNFSDISAPSSFDVQLGPMPDDLEPPEVPLAPVTRADALEPVHVEIPAFTGPEKVTIRARWGDTPLAELKPGAAPLFPLRIYVPWSALTNEYDFDGTPSQTVRVRYQAWRGSLAFPTDGPLFVDVEADLSIVGPDNPDPDPVNPNLPKVHLLSSTGQTDKLTIADRGQPATASTTLHENPVNEEVIELYWRDTVVDTFIVNGHAEGESITFDITWDQLEAGGNDAALPMTYTIRAKDGVNEQRSPTTPVDVDIVTIDLAAPVFPTIDTDVKMINCSSLDCGTQALPVKIPGNSTHLKDGDQVRLDAQGLDTSGNPISGTEFSLLYTLQPGEAASGATLKIEPYATHILPIVNGRIVARYTVEINGTPIDSLIANERVSLSTADGGTCPVRPC